MTCVLMGFPSGGAAVHRYEPVLEVALATVVREMPIKHGSRKFTESETRATYDPEVGTHQYYS